jgi:transposase-like protein
MRDDGAPKWTAIDAYEARRAGGFTKVGGKYVMADGLVSRQGFRKILPEGPGRMFTDLVTNMPEHLLTDMLVGELVALAKKVLHQRNATVFEGLVLNPLLGEPRVTVAALAHQFGVKPHVIYNIKHECWRKLRDAWSGILAAAKTKAETNEQLEALSVIERCERAYGCCVLLHPNGQFGDPGCCNRRPRVAEQVGQIRAERLALLGTK